MKAGAQAPILLLLACVFTVGLTFATLELPWVVDDWLQRTVATPGFDSHAGEMSRFKTELFIGHFHLRSIGYFCFALTLLLIAAGFATKKSGLAALGAVAFMLPVFAQFAGVMFFLAGLGLLNVVWLPVLDLSFDVQRFGLIIRAPFDAVMWIFARFGVNAYRPIVYVTVGAGLIVFFLGTFAWLSAKSRGRNVADFWIYRISRHPQYLGWIIWSYGIYLLLLQSRYPKRSWGIDASLPWLVSTMVIIGVAMIEELNMRRRHGDAYEAYRRRTPFLFPLPKFVGKAAALPFRIFFGKPEPQRRREVAAVIALYTALLIAASAAYSGELTKGGGVFASARSKETQMARLADAIRETPNARARFRLGVRLSDYGRRSVPHFRGLLSDDSPEVRSLAAENLGRLADPSAAPALVQALEDPSADVRYHAARSLGSTGSPESEAPLMALLNDPDEHVRWAALASLTDLGAEEAADTLIARIEHPQWWRRVQCVEGLGALRSAEAVPAVVRRLEDEDVQVRRAAAVSLLMIGSPEARGGLTRALDDEDWEVRLYASEALKRLDSAARD